MPIHFSRSLRRLESDSPHRSFITLLTAATLLASWCVWFVTARIAIYANTGRARLEVEREPHVVEAPLAGRIVMLPLVAGKTVRAGDVLLELDATPMELEQAESRARIAPTAEQRRSLTEELAAEEAALQEEDAGAQGARHEAAARVREATVAAELAQEEERRLRVLQAKGLVSDMEVLRAQKAAEERRNESQAAEFAADRVARELNARHQTRVARAARLRNDLALTAATHAMADASSARLRYEIERRTIRAPISGTLAEVSPLKIGNVVEPGLEICTIVPEGALRVVAFFTPGSALGRIRPGQDARLRLEGFPWTRFGSVPARVSHVDGEVREGAIRVELDLIADNQSSMPLQHGLPAEVDIEIERASPLAMVLRSAGDHLRVSAAPSGSR